MTLISLDPAVKGESGGIGPDPALDTYNTANRFRPKASRCSEAFRKRFFAAQAVRNNQLIALKERRAAGIDAGRGRFRYNDIFVYPEGSIAKNKLIGTDVSLMARSRAPWPLVHAGGIQQWPADVRAAADGGDDRQLGVSRQRDDLRQGDVEGQVDRFR